MLNWLSNEIRPDPLHAIWHFANGALTCPASDHDHTIAYRHPTHRGVQMLDNIQIPRKEKRYVFAEKFQLRFNQAFEEVLAGCSGSRLDGETWIIPELAEVYRKLHRMGYAHSYETWEGDTLAGGAIGLQIGGYITCESMFHRVSNASKAAWGQTILHLKERGFGWVDVGAVAEHHVNYGEVWVPNHKFQQMLRDALPQKHTLMDECVYPAIPWQVATGMKLSRLLRAAARRVRLNPARAATAAIACACSQAADLLLAGPTRTL